MFHDFCDAQIIENSGSETKSKKQREGFSRRSYPDCPRCENNHCTESESLLVSETTLALSPCPRPQKKKSQNFSCHYWSTQAPCNTVRYDLTNLGIMT